MAAKAVKLAKGANGKMVSAKSKTGDPACSAAMSTWVRGRKAGSVASSVFAILAKCRQKARQNRQAKAKQESGKLAEGRGTWQRSEKAAGVAAMRSARNASKVAGPAPSASVTRAKAAVAAARNPAASVHAANPAAPMTTHNPHPGASASPAAGGFSLQGQPAKARATVDQRAARIQDRIDAKTRFAEVEKRKLIHDGKGGLNKSITPEQRAASLRYDRSTHRLTKRSDKVEEVRKDMNRAAAKAAAKQARQ